MFIVNDVNKIQTAHNRPRGRACEQASEGAVSADERTDSGDAARGDGVRSLASVDLFACLDESERLALEQKCTWQRWAPGQQIIDRETMSNEVYFLIQGSARVIDYSDSGSREIVFDEIGPGGYFGELAAIDGQPRSTNIIAKGETLTASLSAPTFIDLLFQRREVGLALLLRLTEVIRVSNGRIMDLSTLGAQNRIYAELLRLAKTGGKQPRNTAIIKPIPVHADIAARVSTTRETVTRVLGDLHHRGVIGREQDAINILDIERLIQMVHRFKD